MENLSDKAERVFHAMTSCETCGHAWCFHGALHTHVSICMGTLECMCELKRPNGVEYRSNYNVFEELFGIEAAKELLVR